jgi:hypothetical protein
MLYTKRRWQVNQTTNESLGKKCTSPGQICVTSHAIQKTQQETRTKGKGPEPNTNNHKTATKAPKRRTLDASTKSKQSNEF